MKSSNAKLNVSKQRKLRKQMLAYFSSIIAVISLYLALLVSSYQNAYPGARFLPSISEAVKEAIAHPIYFIALDLSGIHTLKNVGATILVVGLLLLWLWADDVRRRHDMPGIESGSAKFEDDYNGFAKAYTNGNKYSNTLLSSNVALSMDIRATKRNDNVLVVGGAGSGKSRFFVKPNILQANCNYVITDPSGELLESTANVLREQGYEIKVFNLVEMHKSNCYNPFHYIRDDQGVIMMINCLIKNTTPPESHTNDPFWEKSETALLQALCFYLRDYRPVEEQNFGTIMELLRWAEVDEKDPNYESRLDRVFLKSKKGRLGDEEFANYTKRTSYVDEQGNKQNNVQGLSIEDLDKDGTSIAVKQYKIFKLGPGKTAKSILISCAVRLTMFNLPQFAKLTSNDDIRLEDLGGTSDDESKKKQALFVIIPAADSTFNFLVSMMYSQLFETLYYVAETRCKGQRLPIHVRFLLDEFANIGTIPEYTKKLATMRKYEISCSVILQNLAQIKTMYKDDWESIVGNCDSFVFLGGKEYTTLEYISKELGKGTITTRDYSLKEGSGKGGSDSKNFKSAGRELMTPDELGVMPNRQCVVMIRGLNPFLDSKYDYTRHPRYTKTGDYHDDYRYVNNLDNRKGKSKESAVAIQRETNKKCIIQKDVSLASLIASNPEWSGYPDIYAEFRVIPGRAERMRVPAAKSGRHVVVDEEDAPRSLDDLDIAMTGVAHTSGSFFNDEDTSANGEE